MSKGARRLRYVVAAVALGGWVFQAGCIGMFQQNLEVLFRPEANLTSLWTSDVVQRFGPEIIKYFNPF